MTVKEQKTACLHEIMTAHETYNGVKRSAIEQTLNDLKAASALSQADYAALTAALKEYRAYLIRIFASSPRVRVTFGQTSDQKTPARSYPFADSEELKALFSEDLGDL